MDCDQVAQPTESPDCSPAAQLDRAQGALLGVMVADAAGASIEGLDRPPTAEEVEQACLLEESRFPAGGVSDDSELTIAVALSLAAEPKVTGCRPFALILNITSSPADTCLWPLQQCHKGQSAVTESAGECSSSICQL